VIKASIFRLILTVGVGALGCIVLAQDPQSPDPISYILLGVAFLWGCVEVLVLCSLLLAYFVTGFVHDIGATQDRDPWGRW